LALIDYPEIILKCSNKVFLFELLKGARISMPKSCIVTKSNYEDVVAQLGLPCVLKLPDSTFSFGVSKVNSEEEFKKEVENLLNVSELLIAQEFLYTDFDWRVGILDDVPIFACRYHMAQGHWQIYNWQAARKTDIEGNADCLPLSEVPEKVLKLAIRSARLIHPRGLFGVDLKQIKNKIYVIEVNDNPNIDHGVEDRVNENLIYHQVMEAFMKRIHERYGKTA